jgi:hypothetical protein
LGRECCALIETFRAEVYAHVSPTQTTPRRVGNPQGRLPWMLSVLREGECHWSVECCASDRGQ